MDPAESPDAHSNIEDGMIVRLSGSRYSVGAEVGRGAHCVVWHCHRIGGGRGEPLVFALKVHNEEANALRREADALKGLLATRNGAGLFPQLLGTVRIGRRTGLALSLHGPDLYALQKQRNRQPFPSGFVWGVARQLLSALVALEERELVHADIKPQNILLRRTGAPADLDGSTRVVLIDMGSCLSREQLRRTTNRVTYVQSRWYRAPEVILWAPLSYAADAWSVGCVIAEVALGVPLLPGESEFNQLARTTAMLGAPPRALLSRGRRASDFFVDLGHGDPLLLHERAQDEPDLVQYLPFAACVTFRQSSPYDSHHPTLSPGRSDTAPHPHPTSPRLMPCARRLPPLLSHMLPHYDEDERRRLLELIGGMLRWDPEYRWKGDFAANRLWRPPAERL